jgi:hypothetical protein
MRKFAFFVIAAALVVVYLANKPAPSTPGGNGAFPVQPPVTPSQPPLTSLPQPTISEPAEHLPTDRDKVAEEVPIEEPPDVVADDTASIGSADEAHEPVVRSLDLRMKADREGGLAGCKNGNLQLNRSGIRFICPSGSSKNVTLSLDEIKGVHKNGVQAKKDGHLYHFRIHDMSSEQSEQLFRGWLQEAGAASTPDVN